MILWVSNLVFAPQQAERLVVDTGADEVHAVVLNSEVKISKPEDQPEPRERERAERDDVQQEKSVDG